MNENLYFHDAMIVTTTPNKLKHSVKNYEREHVIFNVDFYLYNSIYII
ncbi:hypothetical protein C923_04156 [Plasmodium falciparum UGT5.1]|uniref:Uncharacterized protein n=1 Tax=Plasmodium falciparum UGT5.1 TaxID=1237627 RepID=W7JJS0_PLAFA|nr:hypothetical protein C923_04156 [Plasmodium falciparum UGT5.1]